jgi:hypothetical protein
VAGRRGVGVCWPDRSRGGQVQAGLTLPGRHRLRAGAVKPPAPVTMRRAKMFDALSGTPGVGPLALSDKEVHSHMQATSSRLSVWSRPSRDRSSSAEPRWGYSAKDSS